MTNGAPAARRRRRGGRWATAAVLVGALALVFGRAACRGGGGLAGAEYEYEEDIHLALDGSATVYVNASLPSLVALRGMDLPVDPAARFDRTRIRRAFEHPLVEIGNVSGWRRNGRRFVSVRIDVADIRALPRVPAFDWATIELRPEGDGYAWRHVLVRSAGKRLSDVGWEGTEMVAVRLHLPSRIDYHNAGVENFRRGNILVWEQPLEARRAGEPLVMEARVRGETILYSTLWLFGISALLALSVLGALVFWVVRRK